MIRIVKLSFTPEKHQAFKEVFQNSKSTILSFEGCEHLDLWQEKGNPDVFFTHSHWDSEEALDAYRKSPFFEKTWTMIKPWFNDRPAAWSVDKIG